jgi:L-threonylcarbamoyladenylate synthase
VKSRKKLKNFTKKYDFNLVGEPIPFMIGRNEPIKMLKISKSIPKFTRMSATMLKYKDNEKNDELFTKCTNSLKNGGLVAFPTETVYGLGADALNPDAVNLIFKAKGRPLTDPVIVHVLDYSQAKPLIDISDKLMSAYKFLTDVFWPGPLTIVAKANMKIIPDNITAKTGYVGIRSPKHIVARELISRSGLCIAAPSANRFGHVSPTKAQHVHDDLNECGIPILIIDSDSTCDFGIESTVAKLEEHNAQIYCTILRRGGISQLMLFNALEKYTEPVILSSEFKKVSMDTTVGQEAPGQLITHYAPDIPACMYQETVKSIESNHRVSLKDVVVKNMTQTPAEIAGDLKFLDAPEGKGFDWTYPKWKK